MPLHQPCAPPPGPLPPVASLAYEPMDYQAVRDADHLRLLSLFHYIYGGISIAFSSIFIIYIAFGIAMLVNPTFFNGPSAAGGSASAPPPAIVGWMMLGMGTVFVAVGWTGGILTIYCGRSIKHRRRKVLTLIFAGYNCLSVPLGTTLGVFTFVVLLRPSVQAQYQ